MFDSIKKAHGLTHKPVRIKVQLPEGLNHLEVIPAKVWWKQTDIVRELRYQITRGTSTKKEPKAPFLVSLSEAL